MSEDSSDNAAASGTAAPPSRDWGRLARLWGRRVCFLLLCVLALIGVRTIYRWYIDPIRIAQIAADDGSAARVVAQALAKQRLCARVLFGGEPFTAHSREEEQLPSVRALLAAGLIEQVPNDPKRTSVTATYRMTRAAAPFTRTYGHGEFRMIDLCYGRPKLGWVYLETDGSTDPAPVLRFNYTVADRPRWADRRDIRAAFPFLNDLTEQPILHYSGLRFWGGRVPDVDDLSIEPAMDVDAAVAGFGLCPYEDSRKPPACKVRD